METNNELQKLKWNGNIDRYELTVEYAKSELDDVYGSDEKLKKRITKNSRVIYNYLLSRSYSKNNKVVIFFINNTKEGHKFLVDILLAQLEADAQSGYNDLTIMPAITATGKDIERNEIRRNQVCVAAEEIADNNASYFGFNLLAPTLLPQWAYQLAGQR